MVEMRRGMRRRGEVGEDGRRRRKIKRFGKVKERGGLQSAWCEGVVGCGLRRDFGTRKEKDTRDAQRAKARYTAWKIFELCLNIYKCLTVVR